MGFWFGSISIFGVWVARLGILGYLGTLFRSTSIYGVRYSPKLMCVPRWYHGSGRHMANTTVELMIMCLANASLSCDERVKLCRLPFRQIEPFPLDGGCR
ncbi:hypothetical protein BS50DRAFT_49396 [Corynespora cassiicola Philippines]|uniref:Uncharacterized protein n=1 Tax=Corynespora cassiicola Philippines TaxID=1448308 RepID=A0A2T2NHV7_CORCC|nr:hypothetical protein BS50DRAFT_49396 [Corynespora cassiicola Philippines]